MIDLDMDEESNGKESNYARNQVNPNLTILLEKAYYDNDMKLIKKEEIIKLKRRRRKNESNRFIK